MFRNKPNIFFNLTEFYSTALNIDEILIKGNSPVKELKFLPFRFIKFYKIFII